MPSLDVLFSRARLFFANIIEKSDSNGRKRCYRALHSNPDKREKYLEGLSSFTIWRYLDISAYQRLNVLLFETAFPE